MQRTITIDGHEVTMVANGATPRIYRQMFGSDLLVSIRKAVSEKGEVGNVEVFENLAFCMARQGGLAETDIDTWLGGFSSSMAILNAIPEIMELWRGNESTSVLPKKKSKATDRKMTTALYLLRRVELGLSMDDLEYLDIGLIYDMFTEKSNDSWKGWKQVATQIDFDKF